MGKILSLPQFVKIKKSFPNGKRVVLATGVFDVLHIEHINYLLKSKNNGDILVVGVDPDISVKRNKGNGRPINNEKNRAKLLSYFGFVDYVIILPPDLDELKSRENFIRKLQPDIYTVSNSSPFIGEKKRIIEKYGGKLMVIHRHNPLISTSKLIERIIKSK